MAVDHKRIPDYPAWIPPHLQTDRLGLPVPPRKAELRTPLYWLSRRRMEVYFVNASSFILDKLVSDTGGTITADEDVITLTSPQFEYNNILPNEGVLIEFFDERADSDWHFQLSMHLHTNQNEHIQMLLPISMDDRSDIVLLWSNGDRHKYLGIIKDQPSL